MFGKKKSASSGQAGFDAGALWAANAIIPEAPPEWVPKGGWVRWVEDCILGWQDVGSTSSTAAHIIEKRIPDLRSRFS